MSKILFFSVIFSLVFLGCAKKSQESIQPELMSQKIVLKELKERKISPKGVGIKFFGDSHVASGVLVSAFKDEYFGSSVGSVGFVPAIMSKYHAHSELKFENDGFEIISSRAQNDSDFPLCGQIAISSDNSSLKISSKKQKGLFGVEILHKFDKSAEIFELSDSEGRRYKISQKSPNQWEYSTLALSFPFDIRALSNQAMIGGYKIYKNGNFVDFCASNGAYATISNKWAKSAWSRDFEKFDYAYFVLAYGTNDALDKNFSESGFYNSMKGLINKLKTSSKSAKIVLISPAPSPKVKKISLAKSALKRLARDENAIFCDLEELINASGGWKAWRKMGLIKKDNIHFSPEGYEKIGKFIAQKIKNAK